MAPKYKFALIQMQPVPVDPEQNFSKASTAIRAAAAAGCHLAVLPEYHLTSWVPQHPSFIAACAASEAYLAQYQALARELGICIVPGTICEAHPVTAQAQAQAHTPTPTPTPPTKEENEAAYRRFHDEQKGQELRNMAHFIAAGTGEITGSYQKKNLWHPERPHLSPGRHEPHTAFDTPWPLHPGKEEGKEKDDGNGEGSEKIRAGMLVCWDLAFPEAFRALIADGAQIIIVPSFWLITDLDEVGLAINPDSEKDFLNAAVVSRAFENTACVVFCNKGGCSQVAMPIQGKLKVLNEGDSRELGVDEDGVSYVEVDMDVLRIAEQNYKVREDIKGKGWHYGYELAKDA